MKNLQEYISESILKSTGSGMERIDAHDITNIRISSTFNDVINMKKLYKDIEKKYGKKPQTESEAMVIKITDTPLIGVDYDAIKKLKHEPDSQKRNEVVDRIFKKVFSDYIRPNKEFNFYYNKSFRGTYMDLGISSIVTYRGKQIPMSATICALNI
jgi:hypothetical protein